MRAPGRALFRASATPACYLLSGRGYGFGETRVAWLALLTLTVLPG
jgi:hypothetical protein